MTDPLFHDVVASHASTHPEAVAVVCGDTELTYGALNARADHLARRLTASGVRAETVVGFCFPRVADTAVAILGILKAGGTCLPLDPDYPAARMQFTVDDSGADLVVASPESAVQAKALGVPVLVLEEETDAPQAAEKVAVRPGNLAYVIYTSGSTGPPKGVGVEHRTMTNLVAAQAGAFRLTAADRVLLTASFTFDASLWDMFLAWAPGATLHIATAEERARAGLARLIAATQDNVPTPH